MCLIAAASVRTQVRVAISGSVERMTGNDNKRYCQTTDCFSTLDRPIAADAGTGLPDHVVQQAVQAHCGCRSSVRFDSYLTLTYNEHTFWKGSKT